MTLRIVLIFFCICSSDPGLIGAQNQEPAGTGPPANWVTEEYPQSGSVAAGDVRSLLLSASRAHSLSAVHIVCYRDRLPERMVLFGSGMIGTDGSAVSVSLYNYDRLKHSDLSIGEGIAIPGAAIVRIRNGRSLKTINLYGGDPLSLVGTNWTIRVVYIGHAYGRAQIFAITTNELTVELGREVDVILRKRFGPDIGLHLRNDSWFLGYPSYPDVNPFVDYGTPPSVAEYLKSKVLWCRGTGTRRCSVESLAPIQF